jgi:hypothetical protein
MKKVLTVFLLIWLGQVTLSQDLRLRIGEIEFFGVEGNDISTIRASLPAVAGREVSEAEIPEVKTAIKEAVRKATGHPATDVAIVCCDASNLAITYIGLPNKRAIDFQYKPIPSGSVHLPDQPVRLYDETMNLNAESVQKNAAEDISKGYSLSSYPPLRAKELAIREYAVQNESLLRRVVLRSANHKQREVAAYFLGYLRQSTVQIDTLVSASRDRDEGVRNNAVRALGVLSKSGAVNAKRIPAVAFIDMLNSGTWTDRNKANLLLGTLTENRDPRLLHQLRVRALSALIEMSRWRNSLHSVYARLILGRVAGIPEEQLLKLVSAGEVEPIVSAAQQSR